jgi:hypothetical protein
MQNYKLVRINPAIETVMRKKIKYDPDTGHPVGSEDVEQRYQVGYGADGTKFEGKFTECPVALPLGLMEVGDQFTAFPDGSGWLISVTPLTGKNGIAVPAPAPPAPKMEPLPAVDTPQLESWMGSVMNGCAMSGEDLRGFVSFCLNLAEKHKNLADAFRKHLAEHGESFQ